MIAPAPYAELVGPRDPLALLSTTPSRIARLVSSWDPSRWARSYAAGKWTGAQLVLHLAQDEIGWGNRARLALTVEGYGVQAYDGDLWVALETGVEPEAALAVFLSLRRLNIALFRKLSAERRARAIAHPEWGEISIDWIIHTLAGHDLHHLRHLETIAGS